MDIQMPVADGLDATRRIVGHGGLGTRVVILTTFGRDGYVFEALRSGVSGFLLKNTPADELVNSVRVVAPGRRPAVALDHPTAHRAVRPDPGEAAAATELAGLTDRERTLLGLLSGARSDAEVAAELEISETMAKIQVRQLLAKLKLHDRVQAVILALRVRAGDAQSLT